MYWFSIISQQILGLHMGGYDKNRLWVEYNFLNSVQVKVMYSVYK